MNRKKTKPKGFLPKVLRLFILLIGTYFLVVHVPWNERSEHHSVGVNAAVSAVGQQRETQGFTVSLPVKEVANTRYLELINSDYAISGKPDNRHIVLAAPAVPAINSEVTLHKKLQEGLSELFAAAREADVNTLYISSGYRDYARQRQVYKAAPDKSFAQPPNHSEHQSGLAADIMVAGVSQAEMGASGEGQWLASNSWKYGLILRYPQGKQHLTGIAYEPWHFRYIGQPHAWYCWENDLSFEEYIWFLKDSGGYSAVFDGRKYSVLYQSAENRNIYVHESLNYSVSSDNTGGYIVTAWE